MSAVQSCSWNSLQVFTSRVFYSVSLKCFFKVTLEKVSPVCGFTPLFLLYQFTSSIFSHMHKSICIYIYVDTHTNTSATLPRSHEKAELKLNSDNNDAPAHFLRVIKRVVWRSYSVQYTLLMHLLLSSLTIHSPRSQYTLIFSSFLLTLSLSLSLSRL